MHGNLAAMLGLRRAAWENRAHWHGQGAGVILVRPDPGVGRPDGAGNALEPAIDAQIA